MTMHRREFLTGAAAVAAFAKVESAEALTTRQLAVLGGVKVPAWVPSGATIAADFANNRFYGGSQSTLIAITRASQKTDLLPSSAAGYAYNTFLSNVLAVTAGKGALIETSAATNLFINSTAPVTQTITLPSTGNFTLWMNDIVALGGSATIAAGTATITGAGAASQGAPVTINCTVVGTVTVTIAGTPRLVQLESGTFGTSGIVSGATAATRAADTVTLAGAANTLVQADVFSAVFVVGGTPQTNPHLLRDNSGSYDIKYNGTPSQTGLAAVSGAQTVTANLGSGTLGAAAKIGYSIGTGGSSLIGNNGTVGTNASAVWAGTTPNNLLFAYMGYLSSLTLFNSKLANTTLQSLTV